MIATNQKGGFGKTATAVKFASELTLVGKKVLHVDTDTKVHCARLSVVKPEKGLAELIDGTYAPYD